MQAMRRDPGNGPAFEGERSTQREEVLERLRYHVRTVRVQAMIAQADPQSGAHPIQDGGDGHQLPTEEKQRRDGAGMQKNYGDGGGAVQAGPLERNDFGIHAVSTLTLAGNAWVDCKSCVISCAFSMD